ncbi:MAG: hypothetical protein M3384_13070 [Acidobacteriota bacterium]|nr:hypothetical protein [Acidobacteriota bacterium]
MIEPLAKRFAFDIFGNDKMNFFRFADFVNSDDIRMIQRGSHFRLLNKAAHSFRALDYADGQYFQRHPPFETRIFSEKNLTHSARSDCRKNFIIFYLLSITKH